MTFGEKLKAIRKEKGYSQEEMAGLLNVSRQAVSKWESDRGVSFPDFTPKSLLSLLTYRKNKENF